MRPLVVIPARFASTRLPGKPLLKDTGKFLVQHAYERACCATKTSGVVVATDDERIVLAVKSFGGRVEFTRPDHASGSDRVAEVALRYRAEAVINLQGDEPDFDPSHIDLLAELLTKNPTTGAATLATPIRSEEIYRNPNCVKVVCDNTGRAMYFSRSPLPYYRDGLPDFTLNPPAAFLHLGVYAYRTSTLIRFTQAPPHPWEQAEKLEQLRLLGLGEAMQVGVVQQVGHGVDTPEDYARFVADYRLAQSSRAA